MHLRLSQHWNTQVAKPQLWTQVIKHKAVLARNLVFLKSELVLTTFPVLILKEVASKKPKQTIRHQNLSLEPPRKSHTLSEVPAECISSSRVIPAQLLCLGAVPHDPCSLMSESFWCDNEYCRDNYTGSPPVGHEALAVRGTQFVQGDPQIHLPALLSINSIS